VGIYALGRLEFAELFANEDESVRTHLINAKTLLVYQRQLNNLHLQENRLRRQREKDSAALLESQDNHKQQATGQESLGSNLQVDTAAQLYIHAVRTQCQEYFEPAEFGLEFSVRQIEARACSLFLISSPPLRSARPHRARSKHYTTYRPRELTTTDRAAINHFLERKTARLRAAARYLKAMHLRS